MPISQKTLQKYLAELRRIEAHRAANAEKRIRRIYKALMKDLNGFIGNEYAMYSKNGVLNVAMLQEKLRYTRFLEEVELKLNGFLPEVKQAIRELVEASYSTVYIGMVEAVKIAKDTQGLAGFLDGVSLRPEIIKRAVENPISGLTLPDVLEKNRKEVIYDIKKQINNGLMSGERYTDVAHKLTERLYFGYGKALTTVRTESHRVIEGGLHDSAVDVLQAAESSGLIYTKRWRTMKDEKVRPQRAAYKRKAGVKARKKYTAGLRSYIGSGYANHMEMNGVVKRVGEPFDLGNGVTAQAPSQSGDAGNDINCRCYLSYEWMTPEEYAKATGQEFGDINAPESLRIKDAKHAKAKDIMTLKQEYALIPKQHRDIIEKEITQIEFVKDGVSRFDKRNGNMYLLENLTSGEVVHEMAHVLEKGMDLWDDKEFVGIVKGIAESVSSSQIIRDEDTFYNAIYRVQSDRFISKYQGRIYDYNNAYVNGVLDCRKLGEYFTEGYKEYIINPNNLMIKDKALYDYIKRSFGQ